GRIDPRAERGSESALNRFDRRPWQLRHFHRGTWRRSAHFLSCACPPARGRRAGRGALVHGDPIAPPVASRRETIGRADVSDALRAQPARFLKAMPPLLFGSAMLVS